jgi:hypothetical protein
MGGAGAVETLVTGRGETVSLREMADKLDYVLAILFIGMVLTPAVVAARSTRDLTRDEDILGHRRPTQP